jgi:hypothetical protein
MTCVALLNKYCICRFVGYAGRQATKEDCSAPELHVRSIWDIVVDPCSVDLFVLP